jgi:biopolymer transport protein ExbD
MPIRFRCPACQQVLSVSSRKAGQKVRCPACQASLKIPTPKDQAEPQPIEEPDPSAKSAAATGSEVEDASVPSPVSEPVQAAEQTAEPSVFSEFEASEETRDAQVSEDSEQRAAEPETAASRLFGSVVIEDEDEEEEFGLRRAQTEFEEMDLTPMVDVTFLLLIFFMITASFTMQKAIAFPPPSPEEEGASVQPKQLEDFKDDCVIVEIHEDNSISIDDERIPLDADLAAMLASKGKNEMLIDAHENSLHETVVKVVDAGNEVQMQRIRLGTRGG